MPGKNEFPFLKLQFDASELKALERTLKKVAAVGVKHFEKLAEQTDEMRKNLLQEAKESGQKKKQQRTALDKVYRRQQQSKREKRREQVDERKQEKMRLRALAREVKLRDAHGRIKERYLGEGGGKRFREDSALATLAKKKLWSQRVKSFKKGAALAVGLNGKSIMPILAKLGPLLDTITRSPLWRLLTTLLDFDGLFGFNRDVVAVSQGLDMWHRNLAQTAGSMSVFEDMIWSTSDALFDMGDNISVMTTAQDRLAALRGFETAGTKMNEFIDTLGGGVNDVTLQAVQLGRVIGMSGGDVATYMGEVMRQTGVAVADIGAVFGNLVQDASSAGISQRFFMDQVRNATAALGMYEYNIAGVSKLLRDMTKDSLQPAEVAMRNFQDLMQMGRSMDVSQLGASFQVALENSGFREGMGQLREMLAARLDPQVFGVGVADRIAAMNRTEFNAFLDQMTEQNHLTLDQQRELRQVYDGITGMQAAVEGDFFELRNAVQSGAMPPQLMALLVNAVAEQNFQGKKLRDLSSYQLDVLAQFLGVSAEQLLTLRDTVPTTEELLAQVAEQTAEQQNQSEALKAALAVSQAIQAATENPEQAFQVVIESLVRTIQQLMVDLVRTLFPYLIDLTSILLQMVANLVQTMVLFVEDWMNLGTVGADIFNAAAKIGGGLTVSRTEAARNPNWEDVVQRYATGTAKDRRELEATGQVGAVSVGESMAGRLQGAMIEATKNQYLQERKALLDDILQREEQVAALKEGMVDADEKTQRLMEKQVAELEKQVAFAKQSLGAAASGITAAEIGIKEGRMGFHQAGAAGALDALREGRAGLRSAGTAADASAIRRALAEKGIFDGESPRSAMAVVLGLQDRAEFQTALGQALVNAASAGNLKAFQRRMNEAGLAPAGMADGGLLMHPSVIGFAERGPEAALPLAQVPEVFAKTIDASRTAVGGGVSIGQMVFQLPAGAGANAREFARAVRQILEQELVAYERGKRPV